MPAGGQAPAVLADRKQAAQANIERFGKTFGSAKSWQPLSEEEFHNRIQRQKKALLEMK